MSSKKYNKTKTDKANEGNEESHTYHPSADNSARHSLDAVLRQYGFKIWGRPLVGEPLWMRGGVIVRQSEAVRDVPHADLKDADYAEALYFEGFQ